MDTTIESNAFSSKILKNKDYIKDPVFVHHQAMVRLSSLAISGVSQGVGFMFQASYPDQALPHSGILSSLSGCCR